MLNTIKELTSLGIKVTIRWQPYILGVSDDLENFISTISKLNVKHIGFEHLKLPLEKNYDLDNKIIQITGSSIYEEYKKHNSIINGREYILPIELKKETIFKLKELSFKYNVFLGFADNEFQYLSDFDCCCSGIDMYDGFENWYKPQISYAIRKAYINSKDFITITEILNEWNSNGSVDKYLNSKSRIQKKEKPNTMLDYVINRWNNLDSSFNPTKYYNIKYTGKIDKNGFKIYKFDKEKF